MSKRRQYSGFVVRAVLWGTLAGALASVPLVALALWVFGTLGFVFSLLYGALTGLFNGLVLGIVTICVPAPSLAMHHRRLVAAAALVTFVVTYVLFFPLYYPILTVIPYPDYQPTTSPLVGFGLGCAPFAFAAALVAALVSRRIAYRGTPTPSAPAEMPR